MNEDSKNFADVLGSSTYTLRPFHSAHQLTTSGDREKNMKRVSLHHNLNMLQTTKYCKLFEPIFFM